MNEFFSALDSFVWSPFLLIPVLLGTGLWLTIRLGVVQLRMLGPSLRLGLIDREDDGGEGDAPGGGVKETPAVIEPARATPHAVLRVPPERGSTMIPADASSDE